MNQILTYSLSFWAACVLGILVLIVIAGREPPSDPPSPVQLDLFEDYSPGWALLDRLDPFRGVYDDEEEGAGDTIMDPRCPWTVTPCGRPTKVRAWSDLH